MCCQHVVNREVDALVVGWEWQGCVDGRRKCVVGGGGLEEVGGGLEGLAGDGSPVVGVVVMVCPRVVAGWVESVVSACGRWGSPCVGSWMVM